MTNARINRLFRPIGLLLATLFCLTIGYHLLIVSAVVDYRFVWGGRLKTQEEMWVFESVSLAINLLFLWIVLQRLNVVRVRFPSWLMNAFLVLMAVLFALNTIGNLMAKELLERVLFTPLTLLSSIGAVVLLIGKKQT